MTYTALNVGTRATDPINYADEQKELAAFFGSESLKASLERTGHSEDPQQPRIRTHEEQIALILSGKARAVTMPSLSPRYQQTLGGVSSGWMAGR